MFERIDARLFIFLLGVFSKVSLPASVKKSPLYRFKFILITLPSRPFFILDSCLTELLTLLAPLMGYYLFLTGLKKICFSLNLGMVGVLVCNVGSSFCMKC